MRILSLHSGHDSSICIYKNGSLEKYFLGERITRVKHESSSERLIKYAFQNTGVLDLIIISGLHPSEDGSGIKKKIFDNYKYNNNPEIILDHDHHRNHAELAFNNSGFDVSIVVVIDSQGSIVDGDLVEVESVFLYQGRVGQLLYKNVIKQNHYTVISNWNPNVSKWIVPFDSKVDSLYDYKDVLGCGGHFDIASILIGGSFHDAGKVMGLSSYGSENDKFKNIFDHSFYQSLSLKRTKDITEEHADFCYAVQKQTQEYVSDLVSKWGVDNVCISGGYGMNIVCNYHLMQKFPHINFYFEPICGDAGLSIGSCMKHHKKLTGIRSDPIKTTSFHGIPHDLSKYQGETVTIKEICKLLYDNKSIGIYNGLAESGQRALGNRSILFNALNPDAKNIVNQIKKREWYRPFAAVVLEEDAHLYFDNVIPNPYMTVCFPVKSDLIPGVTHVDNTCRIQTVNSGYLYNLLKEFKKLSGHGILLNTSFNLAGDPLVETPDDAFETLNSSNLDYLWFVETEQLFCGEN